MEQLTQYNYFFLLFFNFRDNYLIMLHPLFLLFGKLPIYFVNKITKNILSVIIITVYNYYKC